MATRLGGGVGGVVDGHRGVVERRPGLQVVDVADHQAAGHRGAARSPYPGAVQLRVLTSRVKSWVVESGGTVTGRLSVDVPAADRAHVEREVRGLDQLDAVLRP